MTRTSCPLVVMFIFEYLDSVLFFRRVSLGLSGINILWIFDD